MSDDTERLMARGRCATAERERFALERRIRELAGGISTAAVLIANRTQGRERDAQVAAAKAALLWTDADELRRLVDEWAQAHEQCKALWVAAWGEQRDVERPVASFEIVPEAEQ